MNWNHPGFVQDVGKGFQLLLALGGHVQVTCHKQSEQDALDLGETLDDVNTERLQLNLLSCDKIKINPDSSTQLTASVLGPHGPGQAHRQIRFKDFLDNAHAHVTS